MKFITKLVFLVLLVLNTVTMNTVEAQRYWNTAAKVSGSKYVAVIPNTDIDGSFTIECWVNPRSSVASTIIGHSAYRLLLSTINGQVRGRLQINNSNILYSSSNNPIPLYEWTHVACTYNENTDLALFYINGYEDTTTTVAITPTNLGDSVFIGKSNFGTGPIIVDDIRVWNIPLVLSSIDVNYRTPFIVSGHQQSLSMSFDDLYTGPFTSLVFDDRGHYFNRGAEAVHLGKNPSETVSLNNALKVGAFNSYVSMPTNPDVDLTGAMTIEMWINPDTLDQSRRYLLSKCGAWNSPGYSLIYTGGRIMYKVNSSLVYSSPGTIVPARKWTHVAASFSPAGIGKVYINGVESASGNLFSIGTNTDSLRLGGNPNDNGYYKGYIDGVKISNYEKTAEEIPASMFEITDESNMPPAPKYTLGLNFDFETNRTHTAPNGEFFWLRRGAIITKPIAFYADSIPVSPIIGTTVPDFPEGYDMKRSNGRRIPAISTAGFMATDSLYVASNLNISDINLFIGLNHSNREDLRIYLKSPSGDSSLIWNGQPGGGAKEHLITVFDDDADTVFLPNAVDYGPRSRLPGNESLNSVFSGEMSQGWWKLSITDLSNGDIGYLYGWGIQVNNQAVVGIENLSSEIPDRFALHQNYPNPFNPSTNIRFEIQSSDFIELKVFDITGREVAVLVNEELRGGSYEYMFEGKGLSSGIYFYTLSGGDFRETRKMILMK